MISTGLNCGKKLARAQQEYFIFLQFQSNKKQVKYKKIFTAIINNNSYDLKVGIMRLGIITQSLMVHFWLNFSNCAKIFTHTGENCSRRFFTGTETFLCPGLSTYAFFRSKETFPTLPLEDWLDSSTSLAKEKKGLKYYDMQDL